VARTRTINGSIAQLEARINALLAAEEPALIRWFTRTRKDMANAISDQELADAIVSGIIPREWASLFHDRYATFVLEKLVPKWEAAAAVGTEAVQAGVARLGVVHDWDLLNSRVGDFILNRSSKLPVDLNSTQTEALRHILRHHTLTDPLAPKSLAEMIKSVVGLTDRQAQALTKFRTSLAGEDLSPSRLEALVQRRASQMHNQRAQRVARTELAIAHNEGTRAAVEDVASAGGFDGEVSRVWRAQEDERMCPICGQLDGQTVPLNQPYSNGEMSPPGHPMCRCVEQFRVAQ
jgi:SPP1 gp7 family putative phage head morphogenesis protein